MSELERKPGTAAKCRQCHGVFVHAKARVHIFCSRSCARACRIAEGRGQSREYHAWRNMLSRCGKPSHPSYYNYGARGITVSTSWFKFEQFLNDMGPCPDGLTLDRINNDGNYEPGNCRWVTRSIQQFNRRPRTPITIEDVTLSRAGWEARLGLSRGIVTDRLSRGWSEHDAVMVPKRKFTWRDGRKRSEVYPCAR